MKLKIRILTILSLLLIGFGSMYGQKAKEISGSITDKDGNPLSGVVIIGNEGLSETVTDMDGHFSLKVMPSTKLLVEKKGYESKLIIADDVTTEKAIMLVKPDYQTGETNMVNLPFHTVEQRRVVGSVKQIDVEEALKIDQRSSVGSAINGKVAGVFGSLDTWGTGNATYIVDGVPRDIDYIDLNEVKSITVLKDAASKALYGNVGNNGIILIETMRGKKMKREIKFSAESGMNIPKALPEYLNTAEHMEIKNQIAANESNPQVYDPALIEQVKAGDYPLLYPNEDYYSDTYVKSMTNFTKLFADVCGGSENAQYYLNLGWLYNQGWINSGQNDGTNQFNVRGNVDFKLNDYLKIRVDGVAVFDYKKMPNVLSINNDGYVTANYWDRLASTLPNAYPALWDPNLITDEDRKATILENASLHKGMLLGGNDVYSNTLMGDLLQSGVRREMNRIVQFNTGLDLDLSWITEGLSAKTYVSYDMFNKVIDAQGGKYTVYNPILDVDNQTVLDADVIGEDVPSLKYDVKEKEAFFSRRFSFYGTLNYNRTFGDHKISATGVGFRDNLNLPYNANDKNHTVYKQNFYNMHLGLNANYMLKDKYVVDVTGSWIGSRKMPEGDKFSFAPAAGLGWILSQEDFMSGLSVVNFLKLRTSYGILKNDQWDNSYYLHTSYFNRGGNFDYADGNSQNKELNYVSLANDIELQKRKEFTIGFDAALFDYSTVVEFGYFRSESYDQMTNLANITPTLIGNEELLWDNYNSNKDQGIELGIEYSKKKGDFSYTIGANMIYSVPEILKKAELPYTDPSQLHLSRIGTASDAIWGWEADGLYSETDFNLDGSLVNGIESRLGAIHPGDIKYVDINDDKVIDEDDQKVIGNNGSRIQYALNLNLKYKNLELYALGVGQAGQERMRNGDYYWQYGDLKYSEVVNGAYSVDNQDVNASYPRLSTAKSTNNYRNSTFWMYKNNWFNIPVVQLTYHFTPKNSFLKSSRVYVRATDLITMNKNSQYADLIVGSAPKTRSVAVGFVTNF